MNNNDSQGLAEKLAKSDARRYIDRLETLKHNYYVFDKNYQDLIRIVNTENREKEMLELWDLKNRKLLEISIIESLRLFHNFIASAQSLVDQTRVCIDKWYIETNFHKEYQAQVNSRFVTNPIAGFIQDLRNYNLHYSLPFSNAGFTISQQKTVSYSYALDKAALLKWDRWTSRSKNFLNTAIDRIDIYPLVNDFHNLEFDFQTWLFTRIKEIHNKDLKWYSDQSQFIISNMDNEEKEARGYL